MNFVQQIHFFGPINVSTAEMFRNMLLNAMNTQGLKGIEILMSSEGGDLNSGFICGLSRFQQQSLTWEPSNPLH